MRVLVTGATGFTGGHLARALAARGYAVRALVRDTVAAQPLRVAGIELATGDLRNAEAVSAATRGVDVVYHIAAIYRQAGLRTEEYRTVNTAAVRTVIEAAARAGARRVVHCSTVGVHGHIAVPPADEQAAYEPGDVYQETKCEAEQLALSYRDRIPLAVARPTAIYGPGDTRLLKLFQMVARQRFPLVGGGENYYHTVHVDDLVRGLRLLGTHPKAVGEIFILGGESYLKLSELTAMIAAAAHVPPPRLRLPARPFQLLGSLVEKLCVPFGIEPPIHRRRVDFFTKSRAFSIEKAKRLLGYRPEVKLQDGIRETFDWYVANGYIEAAYQR